MEIAQTPYVTDRDNWRSRLERNYTTKKEIWLIYYKKHSGKPRIPYDDAVEEAICFGWISSGKREDTRRKRVKEAIGFLEKNKKLGI